MSQLMVNNLQNKLIIQKAYEMGIECIPLLADCEDFLELSYKGKTIIINKTRSNRLSLVSGLLAKNKEATNRLLRRHELPVPNDLLVVEMDERAIHFLEMYQMVTVKPLDANCSIGVTIGIKKVDELQQAILLAQQYSKKIVIQKYIAGYDYRVLVIDGEMIGVLEYRPAFIEGDGQATISQLIDRFNGEQLKNNTIEGYECFKVIKTESEDLQALLRKYDRTPHDVLEKGQQFTLFSHENMLVGNIYDVVMDRTTDICPENIEMAIQAAQILNIDVAGIDIRCLDISKPLDDANGGILEVNALPDMVDPSIFFKKSTKNAVEAYLTFLFKM